MKTLLFPLLTLFYSILICGAQDSLSIDFSKLAKELNVTNSEFINQNPDNVFSKTCIGSSILPIINNNPKHQTIDSNHIRLKHGCKLFGINSEFNFILDDSLRLKNKIATLKPYGLEEAKNAFLLIKNIDQQSDNLIEFVYKDTLHKKQYFFCWKTNNAFHHIWYEVPLHEGNVTHELTNSLTYTVNKQQLPQNHSNTAIPSLLAKKPQKIKKEKPPKEVIDTKKYKNAIFFEFLGPGVPYSLNYERKFYKLNDYLRFNSRIGTHYLPKKPIYWTEEIKHILCVNTEPILEMAPFKSEKHFLELKLALQFYTFLYSNTGYLYYNRIYDYEISVEPKRINTLAFMPGIAYKFESSRKPRVFKVSFYGFYFNRNYNIPYHNTFDYYTHNNNNWSFWIGISYGFRL